MAKPTGIFQPFDPPHARTLDAIINTRWATEIVLSSAFVTSSGIQAIRTALASKAGITRFYAGVRNGSTSAQALLATVELDVETYVVDTGTRFKIFHPKFYAAIGDNRAEVVIGSANLTHQGLHNNLEAGVKLEIDREDADDEAFLQSLIAPLDALQRNHSDHCYRVNSARDVVKLMWDGIVEDERYMASNATVRVASGKKIRNTVGVIDLPSTPAPRSVRAKNKTRKKASSATKITASTPAASPVIYGPLVWEKPNLPQGDLQLLTRGHSSGVLRLTQARFQVGGAVIDQTTYFRGTVFKNLNWSVPPNDPNKEEATGNFALVIAGIVVGSYRLKLSHKPAWEAGQGNYTTGLHWGTSAITHIRQRSLLGRTLRLFSPNGSGQPFVIEID